MNTMNTINRLLACLALAASAAAAPSAWAHAALNAATPASGATVPAGVRELRLSFNEPLEASFCKVQVSVAGAKAVATMKARAADDDSRTLVVPLAAPAGAGTYTVRWSAMGRDGHRTRGEYRFSIE